MFSYIAIDWGVKNIGIALGDPRTKLILPQQPLFQSSDLFNELYSIIITYSCTHMVIGLPLTFKLQNTNITNRVEEFISQFTDYLHSKNNTLTIIRCNERGTTKQALTKIKSSHILERSSKDSLSAQEILLHYFTSL